MQWKNSETWEHKKSRMELWHMWFAWYPVKVYIKDGHYVKAWLEYVHRKGTVDTGWENGVRYVRGWDFEYRVIRHSVIK